MKRLAGSGGLAFRGISMGKTRAANASLNPSISQEQLRQFRNEPFVLRLTQHPGLKTSLHWKDCVRACRVDGDRRSSGEAGGRGREKVGERMERFKEQARTYIKKHP